MVKYTLTVEGMICFKCESRVNRCVENQFRIHEVFSSRSSDAKPYNPFFF